MNSLLLFLLLVGLFIMDLFMRKFLDPINYSLKESLVKAKLALFSQFIDANASLVQKIIMVSTVGGIDTLWYCLIALLLSKSVILEKLRNNVHIVDKITGVILLAICARVLM